LINCTDKIAILVDRPARASIAVLKEESGNSTGVKSAATAAAAAATAAAFAGCSSL
jgi:hypothetical protein